MAEWGGSIHSYLEFRSSILEFQDAHIQRDEIAAEALLRDFALRGSGRWGQLMLSRNKTYWFVHAVGYLLLATMPRRDDDDTSARQIITENVWSPSIEARNFAQSQNKDPWVVDAVGNRRYGTYQTTVTKRHLPIEGGQKGLGDRRTLLEKLKVEATVRELDSNVPEDITETFWAALRQAEADARVTDDRDWLPNCAMSVRGWISEKTESHVGMTSASQLAGYNGPQPMEYLQHDPAAQSSGEGGPPGASSRNAMLLRFLRPDKSWQSKYYTIAEVGNHQSRGDLWALLDDGSGGFDVYDVTGRFTILRLWASMK